MKNYEVIEHTADIGIRVKAGELNLLFKEAALAMFDIIAEAQTPKSTTQRQINLKQEAGNLEELLVFWLNELLSLSATKELIFFDFKINRLENNLLEATAFGRDVKDYRVNVEIKAATYHGLKVWQDGSIWKAEVIFDV